MKERKDLEPAFLPLADGKRATLHIFSHFAAMRLADGSAATGHYYTCTETGATRLWGFHCGLGN